MISDQSSSEDGHPRFPLEEKRDASPDDLDHILEIIKQKTEAYDAWVRYRESSQNDADMDCKDANHRDSKVANERGDLNKRDNGHEAASSSGALLANTNKDDGMSGDHNVSISHGVLFSCCFLSSLPPMVLLVERTCNRERHVC